MTTIDPQASSACQQHTTPSFPPSSLFCRDTDASSPLLARPEWVLLDEVAETWADFSVSDVTNAHALQAVGNAFLALSFEMSAHTRYYQAYHGIWRLSPATVAQGIAEAISDLREACQQWICAYQWLERSANEARHDEEHLTIIPRSRQVSTTTLLTVVTSGTVVNPQERQVPGRLLSSLTLSQATSVVTTGTGSQPPQAAHGTITFFNSSLVAQTVPAGTTISGTDGVVTVTDQDAIIPAAVTLSTNGQATVLAHAVQAGPTGTIRAGDVYGPCCRLSVSAANSAFHGGAQARRFPMVTQADLFGAVASLKTSLMQSVQAAFTAQVHADETLLTPTCTPTVTPDHAVGDEAAHLGVTVDETCQAESYSTQAMHDLGTQVTMQAAAVQGGAGYHLSGNVEVSVGEGSSTPTGQKQGRSLTLQVKGTGVWTYQFTDAQLQHLAQRIGGKSMREAKAILLSTPGVQSVTLQVSGDGETTLPRDPGQIKMGQLIGLGL